MMREAQARFQLVDSRQRQLGEIVIERNEEELLFGEFIRGPDYSDVEQLFRQFDEAVNLQALRKVDELDAAISALGLHLRSLDGSQQLAIKDVQIWSDGSITCRLLGPTLAEVNGNLECMPSQPVRE
jgi:hypothetical protein